MSPADKSYRVRVALEVLCTCHAANGADDSEPFTIPLIKSWHCDVISSAAEAADGWNRRWRWHRMSQTPTLLTLQVSAGRGNVTAAHTPAWF